MNVGLLGLECQFLQELGEHWIVSAKEGIHGYLE